MKQKYVSSGRLGRLVQRPVSLVGFLFALLSMPAVSLHAAPVIQGDVDQIVSISAATDCVGCSAHELDVLERGVGMMLTEMHHTALSGEICVSEASLAKDLAVLTFDAYRSGAISENRWRDGLRYKGRFAGRLTDATIDTMLLAYREEIEQRLGISIDPGSDRALQTDIYASAQLSRIFGRMAVGHWQSTWGPALEEAYGGFNPVVDAILGLQWPARPIFNQILIYSRVDAHWREAELARISGLQDDFLVGTIEADRDQLVSDYRAAMTADVFATLGAGCAAQAAVGFRQHAIELTQGLTYVVAAVGKNQGGVLHEVPEPEYEIDDEITVTGALPPVIIQDDPGGAFSGIPPGGLVPRGGDSGPGGNGPSRGGGGSGGSTPPETDKKQPCSTEFEARVQARIVFAAKCPKTPPWNKCEMSPNFFNVWSDACGPGGTLVSRPEPPGQERPDSNGPREGFLSCLKHCRGQGGYPTGSTRVVRGRGRGGASIKFPRGGEVEGEAELTVEYQCKCGFTPPGG